MAGASLALPSFLTAQTPLKEKVKIGFIGTGLRGQNHVNNILRHPDVISPAFCDIPMKVGNQKTIIWSEQRILIIN